MWHAMYTGPHDFKDASTGATIHGSFADWREALNAAIGQIKTVAPMGTYATLIGATADAKPGVPWSASDGTHTFTIAEVVGKPSELAMPYQTVDPYAAAAAEIFADVALADMLDDAFPESDAIKPPATTDGYVDHTARAHAELGGSKVERFTNCPASVRLSRGLPDKPGPAAIRGTAAHEVAHMCLLNKQDAAEYIGRTVNTVDVDDAIADGVQEYLDDCRATIALADETWFEVRIDLESLGPPVPMFGTADFAAYIRKLQKLIIKDYKNGWIYVDAKGNGSLRYYALGVLIALGTDRPVSEIEVTICQPNGLGQTLKTETFDVVELLEWSNDLMAAAWRTQDADAPAKAGKWCTFCPAAGMCETRARESLEAAHVEFDGMKARTPEVRLLTPAERGAIHGAASAVRAFLDAVAEAIKADVSGTGWKVVPSAARGAWRDPAEAALTLSIDHGLEAYLPPEIISPAVARGKIKDAIYAERIAAHTSGKKPTKKQAEDDAREALGDLVAYISSGTTLAPEADPRPAILTGGAEFDQVTE